MDLGRSNIRGFITKLGKYFCISKSGTIDEGIRPSTVKSTPICNHSCRPASEACDHGHPRVLAYWFVELSEMLFCVCKLYMIYEVLHAALYVIFI